MYDSDRLHNRIQVATGKFGITQSVADALKRRKMLAHGGKTDARHGTTSGADRDRLLKAILKG